MDREELYRQVAAILNIGIDDVRSFCMGGDESAYETLTPNELANQIIEYTGGE